MAIMKIMNLSPEEKNWLQNECVNPIIISSLKRIKHWDEVSTASERGIHIISSAAIFILNEFACRGVEFDLDNNEINLLDYAKDIVENFKLNKSPENIRRWCAFLTDIQQNCFREMQALQIVKLEYSKLSRDELKQMVAAKLSEGYQSPSCGLGASEMIKRQSESDQFMANCRKIQEATMPL